MKAPEQGRTVLVDMDGVLADFEARVLQIITDEHPDIPLPEARTNFYIEEDFPEEYRPIIESIYRRAGFFSELPLINGAPDGWQRILDAGFIPRICTSPVRRNPTCEQDKRSWLEEHFAPRFGSWVVDTAIISKTKHHFEGVALIDDRPRIAFAELASWMHVLFEQPYNRNQADKPRLRDWEDPELENILRLTVAA